MKSNNEDFGEFLEFFISKRFRIIKLNRVHSAIVFWKMYDLTPDKVSENQLKIRDLKL